MANEKWIARSAPETLKLLWSDGFFKRAHTKSEIEKSLNSAGYNFSGPELGMALMRAKHLTRKGKQGKYEYIQKHPYLEDVSSSKKRSKTG